MDQVDQEEGVQMVNSRYLVGCEREVHKCSIDSKSECIECKKLLIVHDIRIPAGYPLNCFHVPK